MVAAVLNGIDFLSGDYRIVLETKPPFDFLPVVAELAEGVGAVDDQAGQVEMAIDAIWAHQRG
ncbi:MAG: hypothetical protein R3D29_09615 [Nitratireductor sp.]